MRRSRRVRFWGRTRPTWRRMTFVMGSDTGKRRCARCNSILAGDNRGDICRPCQRAALNSLTSPPNVPREFWDDEELRSALVDERHIGRAIRRYRNHPYHGHRAIPQTIAAEWFHISQVQLGRIENGKRIDDLGRLIQWSKILRIPPELLWFKSPGETLETENHTHPSVESEDADPAENSVGEVALKVLIRQRHLSYDSFCREWDRVAKEVDPALTGHYPGHAQYYRWLSGKLLNKRPYPDACRILESMFPGWPVERLFEPYTDHQNNNTSQIDIPAAVSAPAQIARGIESTLSLSESDQLVERLRRTFLAGGLASLALPVLKLDELRHVVAAVVNAQRYADNEVVEYCRQQLEKCAISDGQHGPRHTLPIALGLIATIEQMATEARPEIRRELLRVGSCAAEFTGWLYRDVGVSETANYWRDRAVEWAQVSGDTTMQGYVLLKKSQAVWDERDGLRMLTLAEAAQEGPWKLPIRVRAEAVQQQARGHAMLDGNLALIESKLDEARSLMAQDIAISGGQTTGVAAHYNDALFGMQAAICYSEARQPERSLELYDRWLSPDTFSRRDYAYFLALKGSAHAIAQHPEEAAESGLQAFTLARETESIRTMQELARLAGQLGEWDNRESVHELRKSVLVA